MTERDENLPASEIVERLGKDIKAAITEIADQTPTIAKTTATAAADNRAVGWLAVTWVSAVIAAAGVCWLMLNYAPRGHAVDVTYQYSGAVTEVCTRDTALSTEAHPLYICHPR